MVDVGPEGRVRALRRRRADDRAPRDRREEVRGLNAPTVSYLVCTTGRTGSTLLCQLLRGTGVAGRPEEYFWRGHEPCWAERWGASGPAEYVEATIREATTANGVFGAKVMWSHMPDLYAKLTAVHGVRGLSEHELLERTFRGLHFIWLWREDVVAQAVSFSRAIQTNEWAAGARLRSGREPRFDFEQIHRLLSGIEEQNQASQRWFAANGIRPLRIRYEDLVADMAGVTRSLLAFLDVESPSGTIIEPRRHTRQADALNAEWAARYRQMVLCRSGSSSPVRP